MRKLKIGHVCAVGIIHRAENPGELLFDIKTGDYPLAVWQGHICFIGGSWTGQAGLDVNPKATFIREVREELQLVKEERSTAELSETTVHTEPITYKVKGIDKLPTPEEKAMLDRVKDAIQEKARPFADYVLKIPDWVFKEADPQSPQTTQTAICSVFSVGLPEDVWEKLRYLQKIFGNVSCESESAVMTVDEIIANGLRGQSGQDLILRNFLRQKDIRRWQDIPIHKGPIVAKMDTMCSSYQEYISRYAIERIPVNFES